ncbi:hypothetical protein NIES22_50290 [Calothrix brevissima NIES-22]|nr:hypothetical protein NIES22_50290 [Calothrix brevissima NIES-22]
MIHYPGDWTQSECHQYQTLLISPYSPQRIANQLAFVKSMLNIQKFDR